MSKKSVIGENRDISLAIDLIKLGARLQVLESETKLSYERLLKLYKEVTGKSPSKGMLPFSTDWFMSWQPNMHSSLFMNIYENLSKSCEIDGSTPLSRPMSCMSSRSSPLAWSRSFRLLEHGAW